MFVVMRSPCLMEDEGRHEFIRTYSTRKEAEDWIASQQGEYFGSSNYYIAATQFNGRTGASCASNVSSILTVATTGIIYDF